MTAELLEELGEQVEAHLEIDDVGQLQFYRT